MKDCSFAAVRRKLGIPQEELPPLFNEALFSDPDASEIDPLQLHVSDEYIRHDLECVNGIPAGRVTSGAPTILSEISHPSFKFVLGLKLSSLEIADLSCVADFRFLQDLCISNNRITDLTNVHKLKSLRVLDASMNLIDKFPNTLPPRLFSVNLAFNRLSSDWSHVDYRNIQLLIVRMSKNAKLERLPDFGRHVTRLDLMGCRLQSNDTVAAILSKYPLLTKLDLSSCGIKSFGAFPFHCPLLTDLILSGNELLECSIQFPLPSLSNLKVDCNYDLQIVDIGYCAALKFLDVSFTQVRTLLNVNVHATAIVNTETPVSSFASKFVNLRAAYFHSRPGQCPVAQDCRVTSARIMFVMKRVLEMKCEHLNAALMRSRHVVIAQRLLASGYNRTLNLPHDNLPLPHPILTARRQIVRFLRAVLAKRKAEASIRKLNVADTRTNGIAPHVPKPTLIVRRNVKGPLAAPVALHARGRHNSSALIDSLSVTSAPVLKAKLQAPVGLQKVKKAAQAQESVAAYFRQLGIER